MAVKDFSYAINSPKQVTHQLVKVDFYKRFKKLGKLTVQYDFQNNKGSSLTTELVRIKTKQQLI